MNKRSGVTALLLGLMLLPTTEARAAELNMVTPVFPVRDCSYWREGCDTKHFDDLRNVVIESELPATWLIHYDVLVDNYLMRELTNLPDNQEIGLFLEVTRRWAEEARVKFNWEEGHWSAADKLFSSGYTLEERRRLVDEAFNKFREKFGEYPKAYGCWYVDGYTMEYIRESYGAEVVLGLADQYSTDGYQTWGQYINQPYYASKKSAIEPAKNEEDNSGVVKVLWAPREPTLSFGDSVEFSNFSLQVNDYNRGKGLSHDYFVKLLNDLTINVKGSVSQVVIGLEVGEVNNIFLPELTRQLETLKEMEGEDFKVVTMSDFNRLYREKTSESPTLLVSSQPSETYESYWYMSSNYRMGLFVEDNQVILKDYRYYHQNLWRDNDHVRRDGRHNLSRLVPALVDEVAYGNQIILGKSDGFEIQEIEGGYVIRFEDKTIKLKKEEPVFEGFKPGEIPEKITDETNPEERGCFGLAGGYKEPYSCVKEWIVRATQLIPDIRYSSIEGEKFLGLKIDEEHLVGVRWPNIKTGKFYFEFPVLENFLSIKKKLTPDFEWFGKQEYEVSKYEGEIIDKQAEYGQDNLRRIDKNDKVFENGYYIVVDYGTKK